MDLNLRCVMASSVDIMYAMYSECMYHTQLQETGDNQFQVERSELWCGATNLLYWNHENLS